MIEIDANENPGGALVQAGPAGGTAPRFAFPAMLADRQRLGSALTLREYVAVYATQRQIGPETVRQYRVAVGRLEEWAGAGVRLDELSELLVSHWLRHLETIVAPATARSKRNQILSLWRAAAAEYLCNPPMRAVRASRVPWIARECWELPEVLKLLRAASWARGRHPCGIRRADWWDLAIRVAWDSGLRWGDLVTLQAGDIDRGLAVIRQSKTSAPVAIRLHESTQARIAQSLAEAPREILLPWVASRETFAKQLKVLVRRAGIRPGTWKWLRRGSATNVEAQAPGRGFAARHLGHAPGSRIAEINYICPRVVAQAAPSVMPEELR
jgi:integrase